MPSTVQLVNGSSRFVVVKTVAVFSLVFVVRVVVMFVVSSGSLGLDIALGVGGFAVSLLSKLGFTVVASTGRLDEADYDKY